MSDTPSLGLRLNKIEGVSIFLMFISIVSMVLLPFVLPLLFGILLLSVILVRVDRKWLYLLPCVFAPWAMLIRAQDPQNMVLTALLDIFVIISIVHIVLRKTIPKKISSISFILVLYAGMTVVIQLWHIMDLYFVPAIIRQSLLPILFVLAFSIEAVRNPNTPILALTISIWSAFIVCSLSVMNYFGIIEIPYSEHFLGRFIYLDESDVSGSFQKGARVIEGLGKVPRINLFFGTNYGSGASMYMALAIVAVVLKSNHRLIYLLIGGVLTISCLLSVSYSILIPVGIFAVLEMSRISPSKLLILVPVLFVAGLIGIPLLFTETTPLDYYYSVSTLVFERYTKDLGLMEVLFGYGPIISSSVFEWEPSMLLLDSGIFRVLQDNGLFSFLVFGLFIALILIMPWKNGVLFKDDKIYTFYGLFLTFMFLIHGNMAFTRPYYVLFAIAVGGIIAGTSGPIVDRTLEKSKKRDTSVTL